MRNPFRGRIRLGYAIVLLAAAALITATLTLPAHHQRLRDCADVTSCLTERTTRVLASGRIEATVKAKCVRFGRTYLCTISATAAQDERCIREMASYPPLREWDTVEVETYLCHAVLG